jgi:hypothetical protein
MRSLNSADVVRHHGTADLVRDNGSAKAVPLQTNSIGYVDPAARVRLCLLSHCEVRA